MTDHELNEAVARARGWGQEEEQGFDVYGSHLVWFDKDWRKVDPDLFDLASPAAWGALFEELAAQKRRPRIRQTLRGDFEAAVNYEAPFIDENDYVEEYAVGYDSAPGRALGMAFLKARGQ